MKSINLIIVDDHQLVRDGLKSLLSSHPGIVILGEASSGSELLKLLKENQPDILMLDVSLPGMSGLDITRIISTDYPDIKVMIVSMHIAEDFIFTALKAGARGYVHKNASRQELISAIETIHEGKEYFSTQVSDIILKSYIRKAKSGVRQESEGIDVLSQREKELLKYVAEGFSNSSIAEKMSISVRTVETHKTNILQKLGLHSIVDLVKYAIRNKIIDI